jgi:hypothetical protein
MTLSDMYMAARHPGDLPTVGRRLSLWHFPVIRMRGESYRTMIVGVEGMAAARPHICTRIQRGIVVGRGSVNTRIHRSLHVIVMYVPAQRQKASGPHGIIISRRVLPRKQVR